MKAVVVIYFVGVLLYALLNVHYAEGIQCHTCEYSYRDEKEVGEPNCKFGKSPVVYCTDNTEIPGLKITLKEYRQQLGYSKSDSVYACSSHQLYGMLGTGKPTTFSFRRGCTIVSKEERKPRCKSGTRNDFSDKGDEGGYYKNPMMKGDDSLGEEDNLLMRECFCLTDQCNPEILKELHSSSSGSGCNNLSKFGWVVVSSVIGVVASSLFIAI